MMAQRYRKKPVVIEAIQLDETNAQNVLLWIITGHGNAILETFMGRDYYELNIATLEGPIRGKLGNWIIKGVKGEFYPCKPDIFEMTYEKELK